jgi:hypothetical protein
VNVINSLCYNKIIILAIMIIAFCVRYVNLESDIPYFVEVHYMEDEGGWLHNARNYYLTGEWTTSSHNAPFYTAPGYSYLLYGAFKLKGLSLYSARLLSVFSGTLTVFILWLFLIKTANIFIANVGALFLALTGFHVIYSRLAMAEALLTAQLLLTILFWSIKNSKACAFIAGVLFASMLILKISAIYFIPVFILLFMFEILRKEISYIRMCFFFLGLISILLIYYALFVSHNMEKYIYWNYEWPKSNGVGLSPKYVLEILLFNENVEFRHGYFNKILMSMPVMFILTVIYMTSIYHEKDTWRKIIRKRDYAEIVGVCILVGNAIMIALSSYKPERRYLPLLPSMAIFGAYVIYNGYSKIGLEKSIKIRTSSKNIATIEFLILPIYVFFCWTLYSIWGNWSNLDIGTKKGLSFNGQSIILFPLYALVMYFFLKNKYVDINKIFIITISLMLSYIVSAWLYFICKFYGIHGSALSVNVLTIILWAAFFWVLIKISQNNLKTILRYSPLGFMIFQGIILTYTMCNTSYTYKYFGLNVINEVDDAPIVTDISAPITGYSGEILYCYSKNRNELNEYKKYYILMVEKKSNIVVDDDLLQVLNKQKVLSNNYILKRTYNLIPYGIPKQYDLVMLLVEVNRQNDT